MKIFDRGGKINFVDDNSVFVGFDSYQSCCESWEYNICEDPEYGSKHVPGLKTLDGNEEYPGFNFDPSFFQEGSTGYETSYAIFRLTNGQEDLFLILENTHNGYYSHGFEMCKDGAKIHSGSL